MSTQLPTPTIMSQSHRTLHVAMYPWFAFGHLISFLRLANKLAQRGHQISFFMPPKTQSKLQPLNLYPHLINFIPIVIPHVDGLPQGAETTNDVPHHMSSLLVTAMDLTEKDIEASLRNLRPDLVFFDFTHWMPALTTRLSMKSVHYCIISSVTVAYLLVPARKYEDKLSSNLQNELELMKKPLGFPSSSIKLQLHEARFFAFIHQLEFGNGITFQQRQMKSLMDCDAISFRACQEIEGPFCDYVERQYEKPLLLSGPVLPDPPTSPLEERWDKWLGGFKESSVVYCSFGSECVLKKDQFQELLLGFELMGLPFLVALKPPEGAETIEVALPEGFEGMVRGRGVVCGEWVQQQLILEHPSVGCFVTHCGCSSVYEALVNQCQLVMLPDKGDQFVNARMMGGELKVGVEVEKGEEDGLFTRESVCKAIKLVMDEESQVGKEVRTNHGKWREVLLREGLESSYIDSLIKKLQVVCSS